jgi:ribosomal protein L29
MTAAEKAARITELQAEIAEIETAMTHIRKGGQSYLILSSAGGGSQRQVSMADYTKLREDLNELRAELKTLQGQRAFRIRPGW